MKKYILLTIVFLSIFPNLFAQPESMWQLFDDGTIVRWAYSGGDEFNGDKLDETKWTNQAGTMYCNRELEFLTNGKNLEFGYNPNISSGTIKLIAKKEPCYELADPYSGENDTLYCNSQNMGINKRLFNYTSAGLTYKQKLKYGLFEIRFKLPVGKGLWPSFWLYGGNPNEEFDIFEYKGETPNKIHYDMHCPGNECKNFGNWITATGNFSDGFNDMMGEWGPNTTFWYLNGKEFVAWYGSLNYQEELKVNLDIAGDNAPFGPGPDASTDFPAIYEIDFIRIWTRIDCEKTITISNYSQNATEPSVFTGGNLFVSNTVINSDKYLKLIATKNINITQNTSIKGPTNMKIIACPGAQKSNETPYNEMSSSLKISSAADVENKIENIVNPLSANTESHPVLYVKIFPNPSEGKITIDVTGNTERNIKIEMVNTTGQIVFSKENVIEKNLDIDISNLPKGIYFLKGTIGDKSVSEKIILK